MMVDFSQTKKRHDAEVDEYFYQNAKHVPIYSFRVYVHQRPTVSRKFHAATGRW